MPDDQANSQHFPKGSSSLFDLRLLFNTRCRQMQYNQCINIIIPCNYHEPNGKRYKIIETDLLLVGHNINKNVFPFSQAPFYDDESGW